MVPNTFRALLDANVIYPAVLRDVLLWSAYAAHYQALWSHEILNEATRNLVKDGRMSEASARRMLAQVHEVFPEALVTGYEALVSSMPNDPFDRHVAAAAVKGGAQVIVTRNLRHFRALPAGLVAQSPDDFLCHLFDLFGEEMLRNLSENVQDHKRPPKTLAQLLCALEEVAPSFVAAVRASL